MQTGACGGYDISLTVGGIGTINTAEVHFTVCVDSVRVKEETGNIEFNVVWLADRIQIDTNVRVEKQSDAYNHQIYLVDQAGRRYDHIITNGVARDGKTIGHGHNGTVVRMDGVFVFPPQPGGATSFTYFDDGHQIVIPNITLTGTPQP